VSEYHVPGGPGWVERASEYAGEYRRREAWIYMCSCVRVSVYLCAYRVSESVHVCVCAGPNGPLSLPVKPMIFGYARKLHRCMCVEPE
jgi:hypothetical protein